MLTVKEARLKALYENAKANKERGRKEKENRTTMPSCRSASPGSSPLPDKERERRTIRAHHAPTHQSSTPCATKPADQPHAWEAPTSIEVVETVCGVQDNRRAKSRIDPLLVKSKSGDSALGDFWRKIFLEKLMGESPKKKKKKKKKIERGGGKEIC